MEPPAHWRGAAGTHGFVTPRCHQASCLPGCFSLCCLTTQSLGGVRQARFALKGRARVFVTTAAGALASLDLRTGDVAWRRVLAPGDGLDALALLRRPAAVATLSGGGAVARAWQASDGGLLWDRAACAPGEAGPGAAAPALLQSAGGLGPASVVVLCGSRVLVRPVRTPFPDRSVVLPQALARSLAHGTV